jgi:hypothetical protein
MIENKIRKKQIFSIHDKLLKKFWIVNIFETINRDNLERNKNSFINNIAKVKNKIKENGELKNENECRGLLFSNKIVIKINKNKYEFF